MTSDPGVIRRAVVLGANGFVGAAVCDALVARGWLVQPLAAPRLTTPARSVGHLDACVARLADLIDALGATLRGADAVVNAAGLARPVGHDHDALFGANALLPSIVATACDRAGVDRLVHVSSASVQGDLAPLDEEDRYRAVSAYARSKALGEQRLLRRWRAGTTMLRPTSVHGPQRQVTRRLAGLAGTRLACVAAPGTSPTPQVLVGNVGAAAAYLCASEVTPPPIVLQPWEGWTTASFLHCLSGRWPAQLPATVAGLTTCTVTRVLRLAPAATAYGRRLDLLWHGQPQTPGWLSARGFSPPGDRTSWEQLAQNLRPAEPTGRPSASLAPGAP